MLGLVPFTVVLVGLATSVHTESVGRVIELTLGRIVPGASADVVEKAFEGTRRSAAATCGARSRSGWASGSRC